MSLAYLALSCTIISVGGWVWETCYCSVVERRLARRGMLFGPSCPIYGVCAIVVWFVLGGVRDTAAGVLRRHPARAALWAQVVGLLHVPA